MDSSGSGSKPQGVGRPTTDNSSYDLGCASWPLPATPESPGCQLPGFSKQRSDPDDAPLPPSCPMPMLQADPDFAANFKEASGAILFEALEKITLLATHWQQERNGSKAAAKRPNNQGQQPTWDMKIGGSPHNHSGTTPYDSARTTESLDSFGTDSSSPIALLDVQKPRRTSLMGGSAPKKSVSSGKKSTCTTSSAMTKSSTIASGGLATNPSAAWQHKYLEDGEGFLKILSEGDDRQESNTRITKVQHGVSTSWTDWYNNVKERTKQRKDNMEIVVDQAMGVVIMLNTISIGVSCDVAPKSDKWILVDTVFALAFLAESLMKLRILGANVFFCGSARNWNIGELLLVVAAWTELLLLFSQSSGAIEIDISLFRMVRLVRITRLVRVARLPIFSDLTMMINGASGAVSTLGWSIVLILIPVYGVALVLRETMGNEDNAEVRSNFSTLPISLFTVFRCIVAGDCNDESGRPIFSNSAVSSGYVLVYVITCLLMTFGLFNVIVAIFVENTVAAAKYNDLHQKRNRLADHKIFCQRACEMVEIIWRFFRHYDPQAWTISVRNLEAEDCGEYPSARDIVKHGGIKDLSADFFEDLRHDPEFKDLLSALDISDDDQGDLFSTFDVDNSGSLALSELIFGIKKLRGDPRRSDVIANNLIGHSILSACDAMCEDFTTSMTSLQREVHHLSKGMSGLERMVNDQQVVNEQRATSRGAKQLSGALG